MQATSACFPKSCCSGLRLVCVLLYSGCVGSSLAGSTWDSVFFANWENIGEQDMPDDAPEVMAPVPGPKPGGLIKLEDVRPVEDLVIFGAGPAGLTASIYASRANLKPLLISKDSGQLASTSQVENYPGCSVPTSGERTSGAGIIASFWEQARTFGARSLEAEIVHVDLTGHEPYNLTLSDGGIVLFRSMIVASGAQSRRMRETPGETTYYGSGVASCATCEGWFFSGKDIVVIGGGDTAMEEALFLSRICRSVTLVHRRSSFRASRVMADRVQSHPKINIEWNSTVVEFGGSDAKLTHVAISNSFTEVDKILDVQGAFVAIGHDPLTESFKGGPLELDDQGYILTKGGTKTNLDFVFAAGDVADRVYRQAITSAGTGAMAAMDTERYLCHLGC